MLSGGPPKDGIPAILNPKFIAIEEANDWLRQVEPVVAVDLNSEVKAYPIQILMWHEIVNDSIGGVPILVTFCPLCNTAIAFERTVNGVVFDFGTTGRLRFSNLIMYDRQTETWWQQAEGLAIGWTACIGPILGAILTLLATQGAGMLQGAFLSFVYVLGLGLPLILVSTFFLSNWVMAAASGNLYAVEALKSNWETKRFCCIQPVLSAVCC